MLTTNSRLSAKMKATDRLLRKFDPPQGRISEYFGTNVFDYRKSDMIPAEVKKELISYTSRTGDKKLSKVAAEVVAKAVSEWAMNRGATHFCHWFQPLTGSTAEKHDSFLTYSSDDTPMEKFSASQLIQGEPDASSFPNGGSRSTFEARGYTSWDITSPMFLRESENGKTLCIPTAFVSYSGEALDVKTPHLRSITALDKAATKFMKTIGDIEVKNVYSTCGCEQEYFLIDKSLYYLRPDLVMTGRTLMGSMMSKNQQLSDHYFGTVPERVLAFMQELDLKLHKLGIPAKTRHNEVAPAQFELAPIFRDSNLASDQNQLIMAVMKKIADRHNFVCLLHEKPFAGINGSGKHLNWSMSDNKGRNLLEPGANPHENYRFLALVSIVVDAVKKNAGALRMAVATHGNDHRLGAHEAPPSIISVYLGQALDGIFESILQGKNFAPNHNQLLDMGADQLAHLLKDNTDRNRTSPFAFTGNKFEFRAVGSSQAVGWPLTILNTAMAQALTEATILVEQFKSAGRSTDEALIDLIRTLMKHSGNVVFGGDGYSEEWVKEAARRGLPNLRTSPDALAVLNDENQTKFLVEQNVLRPEEIKTRYNVMMDNYCLYREIEIQTMLTMVTQNILPCGLEYKSKLASVIKDQKAIGVESNVELEILKQLNLAVEDLFESALQLKGMTETLSSDSQSRARDIASKVMPLSKKVSLACNVLEEMVPDEMWRLPKFYDMLFLR